MQVNTSKIKLKKRKLKLVSVYTSECTSQTSRGILHVLTQILTKVDLITILRSRTLVKSSLMKKNMLMLSNSIRGVWETSRICPRRWRIPSLRSNKTRGMKSCLPWTWIWVWFILREIMQMKLSRQVRKLSSWMDKTQRHFIDLL